MKKASRDAMLPSLRCFAHTLQLVVNEGILSQHVVIDVLTISRGIVGHFKRSTLAYHQLDEIQDKLSIDKKIDYNKMSRQGGIPLFTCYNQSTHKRWHWQRMPLSMAPSLC